MRSRFRPGRLAWALRLGAGLLVPAALVRGQGPLHRRPRRFRRRPGWRGRPRLLLRRAQNDNNQSDNQSDTGDSASSFDSAVGYIDDAIPMNTIRLRFDDAFHNNRPSRAEYFYAKGGPNGPGFEDFVGTINYQELTLYLEAKLNDNFSVFINGGQRWIEPQLDVNTEGFGDMDAGFKWAFYRDDSTLLTFQFRTYAPTGDAADGLGTRHVSLEPALLWNHRVNEQWTMEGEFRYWTPVGGTDFAGDVVR